MVDAAIYENLPDDEEAAFLVLESAFRNECDAGLKGADQNDPINEFYSQYVNRVMAVISELNININFNFDRLFTKGEIDYTAYMKFRSAIDQFATSLSVRLGRRRKEYSVKLDTNAKLKLRNLVSKIKEAIDKLDVTVEKKEALQARASALEAEISRERTRFEVVGAFWVEACGKFGEGVEKLEPLRKWLDPIGNLIGQSKQAEKSGPQNVIAATPRPKQIEDQRQKSSMNDAIDDDIPF